MCFTVKTIMKKQSLYLLAFLIAFSSIAQSLTGKVKDNKGTTIPGCRVYVAGLSKKINVETDADGNYKLSNLPQDTLLTIVAHAYFLPTLKPSTYKLTVRNSRNYKYDFSLVSSSQADTLEVAVIEKDIKDKERTDNSAITVDGETAQQANQAFDDIKNVISTFTGASSTSELSSEYTVRGGNFDENLVYVNGIPIYKPFLTKSGQQDGLSFPNPALVKNLTFYGGGWNSSFGDKLSSVLDVEYKKPEEFGASLTAGILGGSIHMEGTNENKRLTYLVGARLKSSQYLLNTLPTQGEYQPRFYDVQSLIEYEIDTNRYTTIGILTTYAKNTYFFAPTSQETSFGTNTQVLKLRVGYEGSELLEYDIYQSVIKLHREQSERLQHNVVLSTMYTKEREFQDIEGGYQFCDVIDNPDVSELNQCLDARGVGTRYNYSRNLLEGTIINARYDGELLPDSGSTTFAWGVNVSQELIEDDVYEYGYADSASYIELTHYVESKNKMNSYRPNAYVQGSTYLNDTILKKLTYGVRLGYWTYNQQVLVSPRIQYAWKPVKFLKKERDVIYKTALGIYQQPPFYRELRAPDGTLNKEIKAQSSVHFIVGRDHNFQQWKRKFKFTSEAYVKYLWNVIPYDVENMRIRYFAENSAKAYVIGTDFRVSGEFIDGEESWFGLSFMSAREDIEEDNKGYIRRPSDQRMTFNAFFQDHLPRRPSLKMNLNLAYSTGLPFGPPDDLVNRNVFTATSYRRVDIGFSKLILKKNETRKFESIWIGLNILNVLGVKNVVSYSWIADTNGLEYAVPNHLSGRFLNVRMIIKL